MFCFKNSHLGTHFLWQTKTGKKLGRSRTVKLSASQSMKLWNEESGERSNRKSKMLSLTHMYLHNHVYLALWNRFKWMYLFFSNVFSSHFDLTNKDLFFRLAVCSIPSWKLTNRTPDPQEGKLYILSIWWSVTNRYKKELWWLLLEFFPRICAPLILQVLAHKNSMVINEFIKDLLIIVEVTNNSC